MKNYYKILNVAQNATEETIKHSFRALAKRYHPDANPDNAVAARRFTDINEAYTVLGDPQKRAEYDAQLSQELFAKRMAAENAQAQAAANAYQMQNPYAYQIQAQVQAQVQSHLAAVRDKAFKDGYDSGYKNGYGAGEKEIRRLTSALKNHVAETEKLKRKIASEDRTIIELKSKIAEQDKQLKAASERENALDKQLQWLRNSAPSAEPKTVAEKPAEENINTAPAEKTAPATEEKPKTKQKPAAEKKTEKPAKATKQTASQSVEARGAAWEKKLAADRQLAKPTLYGTLGVVIWATDDEIKRSYEVLKKRMTAKKNKAKLEKLNAAYAVLSDKDKRAEYNKSIGISDDKIANERFLIAENKGISEEYRAKKAVKDFWTKYDVLQSLSLAGDADAQNELGEMFYYGKTVKRDYKQAVRFFKAAFEQQHPAAIYHLGVCYLNGEGVSKNKTLGDGFLRQASNLGYVGEDLL